MKKRRKRWIILKVRPGKVIKTESHGEFWWSQVRCKCGEMMNSQHWGHGFYRISCGKCGETFISLLATGLSGQDTEK